MSSSRLAWLPISSTLGRPLHLRWVSGGRAIAREQWLTIAAGMVTLGVGCAVLYDCIRLARRDVLGGEYLAALGDLTLLLLGGLLAYGCATYLLARIGYLARLGAAPRDDGASPPDDELDDDSSLVALVPSYCEDPAVVLRTLLSAALQSHPNMRVVLLIDDAPQPGPPPASLEGARALPARVRRMLDPMREHCELALRQFDQRLGAGGVNLAAQARALADLCRQAAEWFDAQAAADHNTDLANVFFVDLTFRLPASRWRDEAQRWAELAHRTDGQPSVDRIRRAYLSLLSVFRVEVSSFERKRFLNLSHAANKASNINSYLGLLGHRYRVESSPEGSLLSRCPGDANGERAADLVVPDADFALILDADTIVSPDYTRKLMRRFRGPGGERLAVVQTPYSTFPGDRGVLQRIAGAQTDIQYLIHQGLTFYDATFWVGANALVRVAALRDLAVGEVERGFAIVKFIRDSTLIEDTESSIDLVSRGWRLFNHPERLAFSMTPPDFGSLLIQRRRWASGGVQLIPKLIAYLRQPGGLGSRLREGFMRLHYLISLGPVSMALLIALGVSWEKRVGAVSAFGIGLVYYTMYARDLHLVGYRWQDIFRVVALNLLLIPVNVLGMLVSIAHAISGRTPRFSRTPKVYGRTRVPPGYLLAEFALLALWALLAVLNLGRGAELVGVFMLAHAVFVAYAIRAFIGYRNSFRDIVASALGNAGGIDIAEPTADQAHRRHR